MGFNGNFVKVECQQDDQTGEDMLFVEGVSDPDNVDRVLEMNVAVVAVDSLRPRRATKGRGADPSEDGLKVAPVEATGAEQWSVLVKQPTPPLEAGMQVLVIGAVTLDAPKQDDDKPLWTNTLEVR